MNHATQILESIQAGHSPPAEDVLALVYDELRRIAAQKIAHEPPGQTLQPTALVHEVWLRLGGDAQPRWENRAHFFAAAGEAMRRILVERARRKLRLKRGGGFVRVPLEESAIEAPAEDEKVLEVNSALEWLAVEDPQKAEIVKLKFFAGLSNQEIAGLLEVNEKTIRRHWEVAKVRLFQLVREGK
jgi:RNA polymerase sigma factor (TIGR02999 family)